MDKKVAQTIWASFYTLTQNMHCPFEQITFQKGAFLIKSLSCNRQIWSNPETGREILVEEKASLCAKPETARHDQISSHLCSTLSMWWNRSTSPPIPPGVLPARFFFDASSLSSSATSAQCKLSSSATTTSAHCPVHIVFKHCNSMSSAARISVFPIQPAK